MDKLIGEDWDNWNENISDYVCRFEETGEKLSARDMVDKLNSGQLRELAGYWLKFSDSTTQWEAIAEGSPTCDRDLPHFLARYMLYKDDISAVQMAETLTVNIINDGGFRKCLMQAFEFAIQKRLDRLTDSYNEDDVVGSMDMRDTGDMSFYGQIRGE